MHLRAAVLGKMHKTGLDYRLGTELERRQKICIYSLLSRIRVLLLTHPPHHHHPFLLGRQRSTTLSPFRFRLLSFPTISPWTDVLFKTLLSNNKTSKMSRQLVHARVRLSIVVAVVAMMMMGPQVAALSLNNSNNKTPKSSMSSSRPSGETSVVVTDRRAFVVRSAGAVAAAVAAGTFGAGSMPSPAVAEDSSLPMSGRKAPDFELPNSRGTGQITTLDSLTKTGKWTVLYFYPGAFSSGCTLEARGFQKDLEEYRKLNAQIVGVSVDPVEKNAQFCKYCIACGCCWCCCCVWIKAVRLCVLYCSSTCRILAQSAKPFIYVYIFSHHPKL